MAGEQEHSKTVWIAFAANALIAVVKGLAGVLGGSSALLSEAAHSVADTSNQGLLQVSLKRSNRPPARATRSATARSGSSGCCSRRC